MNAAGKTRKETSGILKGYAATLASAVIFGLAPMCSKLIYAEDMNPLSLVLLRGAFAVPILFVILKIKGEPLRVGRKELGRIGLLGLTNVVLTSGLLSASYLYMASGTCTVFHYIYPAAVILGGAAVLRKKPDRASLLCVLLCTAGICLFYAPGEPVHPLGAALALSSGLAYAAYVLLLSRFPMEEMSRLKVSLYMFAAAVLMLLPVCLLTHSLTLPKSLRVWLLCLLFSVMHCLMASTLFQAGTKLLGGGRASILSTFEPITSLAVGFLVFREPLSLTVLAGAAMVILAAILIALCDIRKKTVR